MRVIITDDAKQAALEAAEIIISLIKRKPDCVLGLATGSTPIELYRLLVDAFSNGEISFSSVSTFNLDEYYDMTPGHHQSYRYFMDQHLFSKVDIKPENTFLPECSGKQSAEEVAKQYEMEIKRRGGIDLQLLGIGENGHIGFNEPGSSLASRTRLKTLTPNTLEANSRLFEDGEFQPTLAMTMGVGTIMDAKQVLILATGTNKSEAIGNMLLGSITSACPASILQMHPHVTAVIDRDASIDIENSDYFELSESNRRKL